MCQTSSSSVISYISYSKNINCTDRELASVWLNKRENVSETCQGNINEGNKSAERIKMSVKGRNRNISGNYRQRTDCDNDIAQETKSTWRVTANVLDHYLYHDLVMLQRLWCFCSFTHLRKPRSPPKFNQIFIVLPKTPP